MNQLANAVKATLGPKGRNVIIDKNSVLRLSLKTVLLQLKKSNQKMQLKNMGAAMVREVASRTSDVAGDGTTTATVLSASNLP